MSVEFVEVEVVKSPLRYVNVHDNKTNCHMTISLSKARSDNYYIEIMSDGRTTYMYIPVEDMVQVIEGIRRLV